MRRQSPPYRTATTAAAKLVLADGTSLDCTIENVSPGGARILVEASTVLPDTFRLASDDPTISSDAEVAWRTGRQVGIRFREKPQAARRSREPAATR